MGAIVFFAIFQILLGALIPPASFKSDIVYQVDDNDQDLCAIREVEKFSIHYLQN